MILLGRQPSRWVIAAALWAIHSAVYAIREEHVYEVTVTIPTADFYVTAADPTFLEHVQHMSWDITQATLRPITALFDVRSTNSAITARLAHEPKLSSDRYDIALRVMFNNQLLSLTDTLVVTRSEAQNGARVPIRIDAEEPAGGFLPGDYYGVVAIIFDAELI